jgi:hypothetical protein
MAPPPQGAAAKPESPGLPSGPLVHVVLTYARGDTAAAERGARLAQTMRAEGYDVGEPFPVPGRPAKPGIKFFFAQDGAAAEELERHLHADLGTATLVRLPRDVGLPRPGTIEIALPSG